MPSMIDEARARANGPKPRTAAEILRDESGTERGRAAGYDSDAKRSRREYENHLDSGDESLNEWTRAAISSGMPAFEQALQGVRETAISRGVGLGELGTSYEGDLASAFERNIANAVSSQAMNLYNTRSAGRSELYQTDVDRAEGSRGRYLGLLTGERDYDIARENMRRQRRGGLFGGIGSLIGGVGGFLVGGPAGAAAGAQIGGAAGRGIGG